MAAGNACTSRSGCAGTSAPVALDPSSATSTPRFWPPIFPHQTIIPRVPSMSFTGKVRRRACGQHKSESKNVRERGRSCPKAWVCPVPERVCLKVPVNPHNSPSFSCDEGGWKRGRNAWNPHHFSTGSHQARISSSMERLIKRSQLWRNVADIDSSNAATSTRTP